MPREIRPRPIGEMRLDQAPRVLLTDIDDTMTDGGRLGSRAYDALWRLGDAGIAVVPVTGRPAGWCDLIVRQWPVAGVVGENGAFAVHLDSGKRKTLYHPCVQHDSADRVAQLRQKVLNEIPGTRIASDQSYRHFDLAFDFAEDEPVLGLEVAAEIRDLCRAAGANAKISSIHVNAWFGDYDKTGMSFRFLEEVMEISREAAEKCCVFVGDSPNDSPMFAAFPLSVGVSSILEYGDELGVQPRYVASFPGGDGFVETADRLIALSKR